MINIEKIENTNLAGTFDISELLLSEDEVVINILTMENNLPREEAEMMVKGFKDSSDEVRNTASDIREARSNAELNMDKLKNEADTEYKKKIIQDAVDENKKIISDTDTGGVLSSKSSVYKRAREILSLIKEKITQFFRKVKEILQEIGSLSVSLISSIPGAALLVSPFGFNVPGMITLLMQMVQLMLILSSKVADLLSFFKYFKMLGLVTTPDDCDKISCVINSSLISVRSAFNPLDKKIKGFNDAVKKVIKSRSDEEKSGRSVTRRLRKINYLNWRGSRGYKIEEDKVDEDDLDELDNILEQWEVVRLDNRRNAVKRKKIVDMDGKEVSIDELLSMIESITDDIQQKLPDVEGQENLIYDVSFEDGTNLFGLTKQDVDGLKTTYNVIYSENVKYSFIVNE